MTTIRSPNPCQFFNPTHTHAQCHLKVLRRVRAPRFNQPQRAIGARCKEGGRKTRQETQKGRGTPAAATTQAAAAGTPTPHELRWRQLAVGPQVKDFDHRIGHLLLLGGGHKPPGAGVQNSATTTRTSGNGVAVQVGPQRRAHVVFHVDASHAASVRVEGLGDGLGRAQARVQNSHLF